MTEQDHKEETVVTEAPVAEEAVEVTTPMADAPVAEASEPVAEAEVVAEASEPVAEAEAEVVAETSEPVAEAEVVAEASEPVAEAEVVAETSEPVAEATEGETGAEASFTPAEGGEENRQRRLSLKDLEAGMEVEGRVTSVALYGIFVDIGVGRDGLVHISEMSDTRIETPSDLVQIGDTVKVRIKSIDLDARRISLSMRSKERTEGGRRAAQNTRRRVEVDRTQIAQIVAGDIVEGTITGMAPFGAFADIGVGKDGLVHVSELAESRVERPEDAVQVGEKYQFKVLEIDPDGNRISLSLRRALRSQRMQKLDQGQILEGTVSGIATFGAFVDIGVGRDGLVHISALASHRVEKVEDVVKVGDKVQVRVLEVDSNSKRISLTMRLEDPAPEEGGSYDDDEYNAANAEEVVPRTGPGAAARFANFNPRELERRERRGRGRQQAPTPESYSTEDVEEEFSGDATLADLLTKYGGPSSRRGRGDEEEDSEERTTRRQRDAIRRTLQQVGRDD